MKKTTIIITGLCVCLILLGGYLFYTEFVIPKIDSYKIEGYNIGVQDIILKINKEVVVPLINTQGNQTSIDWVSLSKICNG